jgi:hypothetical protein
VLAVVGGIARLRAFCLVMVCYKVRTDPIAAVFLFKMVADPISSGPKARFDPLIRADVMY